MDSLFALYHLLGIEDAGVVNFRNDGFLHILQALDIMSTDRLGANHLDIGIHYLEEACQSHQGSGRSYRPHKIIDIPVHLLPYLNSRTLVVGHVVDSIRELIGHEIFIRIFVNEFVGHPDCPVGSLIRGGEDNLAAVGCYDLPALNGNSGAHHNLNRVAFHDSGNGKAYSRIAGSRFYDCLAGIKFALLLGLLDHCHCNAVLDAAGGVEALKLGYDIDIGIGAQMIYSHHRSMADCLEDVLEIHTTNFNRFANLIKNMQESGKNDLLLQINHSSHMTTIGTPLTSTATKALLLGSGELGKEVAIELQRYGVEVIACDRYANAPAMQIAHRSYVFPMLDAAQLRSVVEQEKPDLIIPEIEAIATPELLSLEKEGYTVIPTAKAAFLTMNREGIRRLAAEELGIPTSFYRFADDFEQFSAAVREVGIPCVVKPIMSSSGHGQSVIRKEEDINTSWAMAQEGGRAGKGRVIVERFVDFDYEITLLTVRHSGGTTCLEPVGHHQVDGDYRESWQPQSMSGAAIAKAREIATKVTGALGGYGIFGVEMFIKGDDVIFSEVSPRPHDTGMVTMISQDLSEFALHARAVLGMPVPDIMFHGPSASKAIVIEGDSTDVEFTNLDKVVEEPGVHLRLFGKPEVHGHRRYGVILATGKTVEEALAKTERAYSKLEIKTPGMRKIL